jgi:hypothetical protein
MLPILAQLVFFLYREKSGCDPVSRQAVCRSNDGFILRTLAATIVALMVACTPPQVIAGTVVTEATAPAAAAVPPGRWISVSRVVGRITSRDLGLVINTADPYSVEIGALYAATRKIPESQILRVELPATSSLTSDQFQMLAHAIETRWPGPGRSPLRAIRSLPR